jgi:hypothetical protein
VKGMFAAVDLCVEQFCGVFGAASRYTAFSLPPLIFSSISYTVLTFRTYFSPPMRNNSVNIDGDRKSLRISNQHEERAEDRSAQSREISLNTVLAEPPP